MIQKLKVNNKRITGDDLVTIVRKLNEVIEAINEGNAKEDKKVANTVNSNAKEDENVPKKSTKVRKTSNQEG